MQKTSKKGVKKWKKFKGIMNSYKQNSKKYENCNTSACLRRHFGVCSLQHRRKRAGRRQENPDRISANRRNQKRRFLPETGERREQIPRQGHMAPDFQRESITGAPGESWHAGSEDTVLHTVFARACGDIGKRRL